MYEFLDELAAEIGKNNIAHGFREEGDDVRRAAEVEGNLGEYNRARLADYYSKRILLVISEGTEAFEELRSGLAVDERYYTGGLGADEFPMIGGADPVDANGKLRKPEGVPSEMADILIRVLDFFDEIGVSVGSVVAEKMAYNATRPYRHGRKF